MADAVTGPTFGSDGFSDGSSAYANGGKIISFWHLPSETSVYFKAFITNFNETFASDWAQESVYGRADPIYMFKQTRRSINLAFKIPAGSAQEAYENLARVQALAQFLYPTYDTPTEAQTITQSPLVRLKVMNFLRKHADTPTTGTSAGDYSSHTGGLEAANGALGVIESLAIDHSLAAVDGVIDLPGAAVLSKIIEVNLNFSVIHEEPLGWGQDKKFATPTFPYSAAASKASISTAAAGAPTDGDNTAAIAEQEANSGGWLQEKRVERLEKKVGRIED